MNLPRRSQFKIPTQLVWVMKGFVRIPSIWGGGGVAARSPSLHDSKFAESLASLDSPAEIAMACAEEFTPTLALMVLHLCD